MSVCDVLTYSVYYRHQCTDGLSYSVDVQKCKCRHGRCDAVKLLSLDIFNKSGCHIHVKEPLYHVYSKNELTKTDSICLALLILKASFNFDFSSTFMYMYYDKSKWHLLIKLGVRT